MYFQYYSYLTSSLCLVIIYLKIKYICVKGIIDLMSEINKKATARDVAREAGVSVATVSYIMNDRTDQKISPETRKKVLQIANLLNYVPSHAAQSLATGRNNAIGISYLTGDIPTHNAAVMGFANRLIERLNRLKYDVTFIPAQNAGMGLPINRNIDAIIAIDLSQADFRSLADNYLVPVICVDMIVSDTLFYQIYEDVPFLAGKAWLELNKPEKVCFVYDCLGNAAYEEFILKGLDATFTELAGSNRPSLLPIKSRELTPALLASLEGYSFIVHGAVLLLHTMSLIPSVNASDLCAIVSDNEESLLPNGVRHLLNNDEKKANMTMSILMNSLKRIFDVTHDHPVR